MRTYDYIIRVSKTGGRLESAESTMTIDDQRAAARAAISNAGARIGMEHKALDVSGFTAVDSTAYRKAVDRIRLGQAHGLVVAYGDRLARNWRKVGRFYDELEELGAEVLIAGMPGVDYRTSTGRQVTGMMAVMSEGYYFAAKERGDRIADRTIGRGVANRVPFGYRRNAGPDGVKTDPNIDGKALVPDKQTAPILRRVFEMRADGQPWSEIVRWLEAEGVRPFAPKRERGSGEWTVSTLRNMIGNEAYLGVVKLGSRRVDHAHAPLVTRALWRAAQSSTSVRRTGQNAAGLAGGLLICGCCGRRLSVTGSNPAYSCRRTAGNGKCERPTYISKARADEYVERAIVEILSHGSLDVLAVSREVDRLRQEWRTAQAELESFVVSAKALDAQTFKLGLDARQEAADEARVAYDDALADAEAAAELPDASGWAALDFEGKRRVARTLVAEVVVSPPASIKDRGPHADVSKRLKISWNGSGQAA